MLTCLRFIFTGHSWTLFWNNTLTLMLTKPWVLPNICWVLERSRKFLKQELICEHNLPDFQHDVALLRIQHSRFDHCRLFCQVKLQADVASTEFNYFFLLFFNLKQKHVNKCLTSDGTWNMVEDMESLGCPLFAFPTPPTQRTKTSRGSDASPPGGGVQRWPCPELPQATTRM